MISKLLLFYNSDIGHQEKLQKNNHLQMPFFIQKPMISLLNVKNRWANILQTLMNQKNNDFNSLDKNGNIPTQFLLSSKNFGLGQSHSLALHS